MNLSYFLYLILKKEKEKLKPNIFNIYFRILIERQKKIIVKNKKDIKK